MIFHVLIMNFHSEKTQKTKQRK